MTRNTIWHGYIWPIVAVSLVNLEALATSVAPGPWQDMVAASDLVGVMECTGAGIYASRFRIVDAWRGDPINEEFTIHCTALVGERYVGALRRMFYQKVETPARMPGIGDPIGKTWFPEPNADYRYHIAWGWMQLPVTHPDSIRYAFPEFEGSLDDFLRAVKALPITNRPSALPLVAVTPEPYEPGEVNQLRTLIIETRSIAVPDTYSEWWDALHRLSYADATFVARRLSKARSSEMGFRWPAELAGAASTMLWECPESKRKMAALELLGAQERIIRLVGGAQLLGDGSAKARRVLSRIADDDGDLAEWANFILASYNEPERMARAIDAIAGVGYRRDRESGPARYSDCVEVVLSNSAAAGTLPQPGRPDDVPESAARRFPEALRNHLAEWWDCQRGTIQLIPIGSFPMSSTDKAIRGN